MGVPQVEALDLKLTTSMCRGSNRLDAAPSPQPLLSPPPVHMRRAVEEFNNREVSSSRHARQSACANDKLKASDPVCMQVVVFGAIVSTAP